MRRPQQPRAKSICWRETSPNSTVAVSPRPLSSLIRVHSKRFKAIMLAMRPESRTSLCNTIVVPAESQDAALQTLLEKNPAITASDVKVITADSPWGVLWYQCYGAY